MKRKRIISLALVLLLAAGAATALAASAGSAEDPLISLSYITDTYIPGILNKAKAAVASALAPVRDRLSGGALPGAGGEQAVSGDFKAYLISSGGGVRLRTGGSAVLLSGEATLQIDAGAVVDVTNGVEARSGALAKNTRLLGAEDCSAFLDAGTGAVIAVSGNASITNGTAAANPFQDVQYDDWFYVDVIAAYTRGLIAGMTSTSYAPDGQLTAAQAVKLAACLHQSYYTGAVTLQNSPSGHWYRSYADYAVANGILDAGLSDAEYAGAISRARFVSIFYRALPASEYAAKNTVPDGAIPDVGSADPYAREIYAFFRAGILTGNDRYGTFLPASHIRRSEVAAILTRMYDAGARKSFALP